MRLYFDMDNTLIGDRNQLRPFVREVLEQLHVEGHHIFVWSGAGIRWREVHEHRLSLFVRDCFNKPIDEPVDQTPGRSRLPDLVVDDIPSFVETRTGRLGGIVVRPYYLTNPNDREMEEVYAIIQEVEERRLSSHPAFRQPRADWERALLLRD